MKKLAVVLACLDIIIITMLFMGYPQKWFSKEPEEVSSSNSYYNTSEPTSQESSSEAYAMTSEVSSYYIVREYNGHIGIFHNDSQTPYYEILVEINTLPQKDQELLKRGIHVSNTDNLNEIIEDYES